MKKKKMLVIVDMINGFIKEGNLADNNITRIIPAVIKKNRTGNKKQLFDCCI